MFSSSRASSDIMLLSHGGSKVSIMFTDFTPSIFFTCVFMSSTSMSAIGQLGAVSVIYVGHALGIEIYFVYQSQVVYVDGYFGIVDVLQRENDLVLHFQNLFRCHLRCSNNLPRFVSGLYRALAPKATAYIFICFIMASKPLLRVGERFSLRPMASMK